jgi:nucleoid-associated protein YgaU
MKIYKQKLIISLIAFVFIISCGDKVPVKEMSLAKLEISGAMSVMAKKYAPQEINEAEKKLIESHEFVKQDALEKSKDSAIAARAKAKEAYDKSIPLLAKDTLDIAKQSLEQAEVLYAEVLAENDFKQSKAAFDEANKLYEQKSYYPSYEKSVDADKFAKEARNVSIGKKEILNKSIAEVKVVLADAEKYNASVVAKDKVQTARENLAVAEESYKSMELKKGFKAVEVAGTNADEAYLIAIRETAKGRIDDAEKLFGEAEKSDGAAAAKDELNGAKEALGHSKTLFQDSKYKEAILSAEESARLSNKVLGALNQTAKDKIASAEGMYDQAKNSEGAKIAVDQLNAAGSALDLSKSLFKEGRYKESISAASESERLSKIVIDTKEKAVKVAAGGKGTGSVFSEDYFIYKVRYIPERRDCLWRIAEKYYSNPLYWQQIYKANNDKIYNPNLIWPDMLLKVPKMKKAVEEEKKEPSAKAGDTAALPEKAKQTAAPVKVENKETAPASANPAERPANEK